jgi:hypothetical protein
MSGGSSPRIGPLATLLCLGIPTLIVFWRVFEFPFVYDDWGILRGIVFGDHSTFLKASFVPAGKVLYRPLGAMYFLCMYLAFGLRPFGFHLAGIILHIVNSCLVVWIVRELASKLAAGGQDRSVEARVFPWVVGLLYAVAISVHTEPLVWLVGFYDIAGALFFFLGILFYLKGHPVLSALAYALGLLTKESVVVLPAVLMLYALFVEESSLKFPKALLKTLSRLRVHWAMLVGYAIIKLYGVSPAGLAHDESYVVSLGPHVVRNFLTYWGWAFNAISPVKDSGVSPWLPFLQTVAPLAVILAIVLWRGTGSGFLFLMSWKSSLFLLGWLGLGIAPVIIFPNHYAKYFLVYSLPPFLVLMVSILAGAGRTLNPSGRLASWIICGIAVLNVPASAWYFNAQCNTALASPGDAGTNNLLQKATLTRITENYLRAQHPLLPHSATLVFDWLDPKVSYWGAAPQVWYGDTTILTCSVRNLARAPDGRLEFLQREIDGHYFLSPGGSAPYALDTDRVYFFVLYKGEIEERPVSALGSIQ